MKTHTQNRKPKRWAFDYTNKKHKQTVGEIMWSGSVYNSCFKTIPSAKINWYYLQPAYRHSTRLVCKRKEIVK
jgi:hypothetical protein